MNFLWIKLQDFKSYRGEHVLDLRKFGPGLYYIRGTNKYEPDMGSNGVGKSSLVNAFLNEDRMATQAIRETDDQGRHTTSHRQLILLPGGRLMLDTPGIREVGLIDAEAGVSAVFEDIEGLLQTCRFTNCSHANEPGCAVQAAVQSGVLDPARWAHYQKLTLEAAVAEHEQERAEALAGSGTLGVEAEVVQHHAVEGLHRGLGLREHRTDLFVDRREPGGEFRSGHAHLRR